MAKLHLNFVYGVLSVPVLSTQTTWRSARFVTLPAISAPYTLTLVVDPTLRHGSPEIVYITAHAFGTDTVTVQRARESTVAKNFAAGTDFVHQITADEITNFTVVGHGTVESVNGQPGPVVDLDADDVGAATPAYVDASVAGLDAADVGAIASINGDLGPVVVLDADDVGAATPAYVDAIFAGIVSALYVHTQDVASVLWQIPHGLGLFPNVTITDTLLRVVDADVTYVDANNINVESAVPATGKAFLT